MSSEPVNGPKGPWEEWEINNFVLCPRIYLLPVKLGPPFGKEVFHSVLPDAF